jgi:hypothetical protein
MLYIQKFVAENAHISVLVLGVEKYKNLVWGRIPPKYKFLSATTICHLYLHTQHSMVPFCRCPPPPRQVLKKSPVFKFISSQSTYTYIYIYIYIYIYRVITSVPLFCAHAQQVSRCIHPFGWNWSRNLLSTRSCSFFAQSPEKKWVHENVSFRSVHDGQLHLCMYQLCDFISFQNSVPNVLEQ